MGEARPADCQCQDLPARKWASSISGKTPLTPPGLGGLPCPPRGVGSAATPLQGGFAVTLYLTSRSRFLGIVAKAVDGYSGTVGRDEASDLS